MSERAERVLVVVRSIAMVPLPALALSSVGGRLGAVRVEDRVDEVCKVRRGVSAQRQRRAAGRGRRRDGALDGLGRRGGSEDGHRGGVGSGGSCGRQLEDLLRMWK